MFRIKICGVKRRADLQAAAQAGADAVGLNFYRQSIRYVDTNLAQELAADARELGLAVVGVFVDEPVDAILELSDRLHLDYVQLHGNEPLETAQRLLDAGDRVLRAVRLPLGRLEPQEVESRVAEWRTVGCDLLLDADAGAQIGGAGLRLDWTAIGKWNQQFAGGEPWVLAGGLTPQSVAKAISQSGAWGVDVASGVEQPRGVKSAELIADFVTASGL